LSPDALVIGVPPGGEAAARRRLQQLSSLRNLRAVREDRIVCVPNNLFLSTSHHLAGAAERIAAVLDGWGER
jgi:ABC-type Fe3+-hydroxamate transport system substrate-binding protein